jgi:hypothetical protein
LQSLDIGESLLLILGCQTGRRVLVGSGTIKNDFLVLGQVRDPGKELRRQQGPFQMDALASIIAGIGTDQEAPAGFQPSIGLWGRDSRYHDSSLSLFRVKSGGQGTRCLRGKKQKSKKY